jgi:hypothetical protein
VVRASSRRLAEIVAKMSSPLLIALGALWVLDGLLQLQPSMFTRTFLTDAIAPAAQGQPWFVTKPIGWTVSFLGPHIALWNVGFALIQLAIGLGIMWRASARRALVVSFAWAAAVWWLGECLGGLASGQGSLLTGGPGAVVLYGVVGLLLWPRKSDGRALLAGRAGSTLGLLAWAVLWVGAGVTQLVSHTVATQLSDAAGDEPGLFVALDRTMARFASAGHGHPAAILLGCLEVAIGLAILVPRGRCIALVAGIVLSATMWVFVQDFGELFTGSATDPNAAPLYVLLAAALFGLTPRRATRQTAATIDDRPAG